jgi:hypothetical protein
MGQSLRVNKRHLIISCKVKLHFPCIVEPQVEYENFRAMASHVPELSGHASGQQRAMLKKQARLELQTGKKKV